MPFPTYNPGDYAAEPAPGTNSLHAFITAGQSNAQEFRSRFTAVSSSDPDVDIWRDTPQEFQDSEHFWAQPFGLALHLADAVPVWNHHRAVGASTIEEWQPGSSYLNELLANIAAGIADVPGSEPQLWIWYQGEAASASTDRQANYAARYAILLNEIRVNYGYVPGIQIQLGPRTINEEGMEAVRDIQRRLDSDSGDSTAQLKNYVVPAWDLALEPADTVHLSGAAAQILGSRIYDVWRAKVTATISDPRPRLVSITQPAGTTIRITFDQEVNDHPTYDDSIEVLDDGTPATISSAGRTIGDTSSIDVQLAGTPSGTITVAIQRNLSNDLETQATNVPQGTTGMPTLAFGPIGLFP